LETLPFFEAYLRVHVTPDTPNRVLPVSGKDGP
jgi:hypothetical protein